MNIKPDLVADREHDLWLRSLRGNKNKGIADNILNFDIELLQRPLEILYEECGCNWHSVAYRIGMDNGQLRRFKAKTTRTVSFDNLERIYLSAGMVTELNELLPTYGTPGWSPYGDCCTECGSWWREHYAAGMCNTCYNVEVQSPIIPDWLTVA